MSLTSFLSHPTLPPTCTQTPAHTHTHLVQPDINKYASDILPVLLSHLQQLGMAASGSAHTSRQGVTKAFYALDMFCESLGGWWLSVPTSTCCCSHFHLLLSPLPFAAVPLPIAAVPTSIPHMLSLPLCRKGGCQVLGLSNGESCSHLPVS